jgi:hypothetical protein
MKTFVFALASFVVCPAFALAPAGKVTQIDMYVDCDSGHCDLLECSATQFSTSKDQLNQKAGKLISSSYATCEPWDYLVGGIGGDVQILISKSEAGQCIEKVKSFDKTTNWTVTSTNSFCN